MNIVITGGSAGLGRALVEACAISPNNRVLFTYCRHEDKAQALASSFDNVRAVRIDFCDDASVNSFVDILHGEETDVLINNAYAGNPQGVHFQGIQLQHHACHKDYAGLCIGYAETEVWKNHQYHHIIRDGRPANRILHLYLYQSLHPPVVEELEQGIRALQHHQQLHPARLHADGLRESRGLSVRADEGCPSPQGSSEARRCGNSGLPSYGLQPADQWC